MKQILKKTKVFKFIKSTGLLNKEYRRFLIINFIFQRLFGLNRECPWSVNFTSTIVCAKNIEIGKNVAKSFALSGNCYFQAINGIIISDNTIFASGVKIISSDHDKNHHDKHVKAEPIRIGKNCWIGSNVVILPKVQIADNVIIGAGTIVTKSINEAHAIVVGNPGRVLRKHNVQD